MKKTRFYIVIAFSLMVVALFGAANISGVAAAPAAYTSCFQVQNLNASQSASVVLSYYKQASTEAPVEVNDTISANASNTYCPLAAVAAGFNGSLVISSDVEVAAIANVSGDANFGAYNASYSGFTSGSTTVNIPLLFKNNAGFNTWFNVQNVGSAATNVTVTYSDGTSAGPVTIQAGRAHTFDQSTETHSLAVFAASVSSSSEPVVATILEVGPNSTPMLFAYNGFTAAQGSTNPVMPLIQYNNFGMTSGIQIQNTGGSSTNVTITYTPSTNTSACQGGTCGTTCTETLTIAAGKSASFGQANAASCLKPQTTFVGSARVSANSASMNLVGIVNQHNFGINKGASYGTFNPANATSSVVMPLIMDRNFGYFTGFNVANVGTSSTAVTCTFSGSAVTVNKTLAAGEALTSVQLSAIGDKYVGSATCNAGSGGQIVSVVNEYSSAGTQDTFLVYEGTNK